MHDKNVAHHPAYVHDVFITDACINGISSGESNASRKTHSSIDWPMDEGAVTAELMRGS